ncbi:HNH endonuclease family protein [Nocardioides antri]|uniref:HNH endonuclease n=1 Tax=Nocardioides antri TaxID=2607659 RepID=A0A5B1M282_9ACTN|nr:HNH endonuclease family protein [Nocardioides antri]KAA1425877.1 HNH endonuclease [Nocardioides antri]
MVSRTYGAAVATVVLALSGCAPTDTAPSAPEPSESPPAPTDARRLLAELRLADREQPDTYDRDTFGSPWSDTDGNGCNQRDDVLLRDAVPGTVTVGEQDACDHDVLAGTWIDPYTGTTLVFDDLKDLSQAQAIQIDHVVPLAEAWYSGAAAWTDEQRRTYANDLTVLLAVDGPTNAGKGADDPAAWRPRKDYQCAYARRWIRVKHHYDLTVDPSEVRALEEMLGYC